MKAIYNLDVSVDSKAPKPSSQTEEVPQGKKSRAKMVGEMHKEAQQAVGGPTSLGATSKEGAHPQINRHDASADSTTEADPVLSAPNDSIPAQQEDLSDLLKDIRSAIFNLDSPQDELIIILDKSEEEEEKDELEQQKAKVEAEVALMKARPSYPDINQLTNLLVTSLKPELSKLLASHDFASCLLNALKELPSKFTKLSGEIKELKKHVQDMEIELPRDLKEILTKLETFTSTVSSLSSKVTELKNIQWKLPAEFATVVENAPGATTTGVPSAGQATASPTEGEKNTDPATTNVEPNLHDELVDLLGINIVTQYYNKKLLYDKYCDKMLKRRKSSKIINCNVIIQNGPITLQIYREDGTVKVNSNVKVSDLHLAEWKEFESLKFLQHQLFKSLEDWEVSSLQFM
ncbi:hypothetical protein Tco_0179221 [Tanacetum coccineum]